MTTMTRGELGAMIRWEREALGLTQTDVAERAGRVDRPAWLSQTRISAIERGVATPSRRELIAIAFALLGWEDLVAATTATCP